MSSLTQPANFGGHDSATPPANAEKPSLLFVDDERAILMALRVVFRNGYDVTVTTDGFEAIELMKTKRFHVIVSDQRMPTITGVQVLTKARELSPNSVRILLTGYSDTDAILGAINDVEVHRFMHKPWDNHKIKQVIEESVRLAKSLADEDVEPPQAPASKEETASERVQRTLAEVVQFPVQHRAHPAFPDTDPSKPAAIPHADKDTILIVDPGTELYLETRIEVEGRMNVEHAKSIDDVFRALAAKPVHIMVCAFDIQSEADRTFLQILKREYPFILVVAICDSVDAVRLIELINQAKIYRYIKRPISMKILSHYLASASKLLEQTRENRKLLLSQRPEEMPQSVANSAISVTLTKRFETVRSTLWGRFTSWLGVRK